LPPRPAGFSGAVGQFELEANFNAQTLNQGVPAKLTVTVKGTGNPDAIGDPVVAELPWAQVSEPDRKTDVQVSAQRPYPLVTKRYTYEIVPLRAGVVTVPPVEFIYFNPEEDKYESKTAGPFSGVVNALQAVPEDVLTAAENQERVRSVEIITDDIMPIARKVSGLEPARPNPWVPVAVAVFPIAAFAGIGAVAARRRRFARDSTFARAFHAHRKALAAFTQFKAASNHADALFSLVVQYVADVFGRDPAGMTSSDVRELLETQAVDLAAIENAAKILRACERVNYAAHDLSSQEWDALANGAREFIDQLEAQRES
jgi:hypothetical protein